MNDHETSCSIRSGGSLASVSVTFAAAIETVQLSFCANSVSGSSVYVRGPPLAIAACAPLVVHVIENQLPVTSTSSLNVMAMSASNATSDAFDAGVCALTPGAWSASHDRSTALLRGAVARAAKSAALSSVSSHPPRSRCAEVVLVRVGAAPAPSKKFAFP